MNCCSFVSASIAIVCVAYSILVSVPVNDTGDTLYLGFYTSGYFSEFVVIPRAMTVWFYCQIAANCLASIATGVFALFCPICGLPIDTNFSVFLIFFYYV